MWEKIKKFFMCLGNILAAVAAFLLFRRAFGRGVDDSEGILSDIRDCDARKERLEERQRDLNAEQREIVERQRESVSKERELGERERRIDEREKGAVEQLGKVVKSVEARRNS